jgi:hypothetical protein
MSLVSRHTFENRQDYPYCLQTVKIFQSRLSCVKIFVETVEINRDCWDFWDLSQLFEIYRDISTLSRLFEIYRDISTLSRLFEVLQDQKSRQIEKSQSRNVIKLTNSRSRSRQTVKICQKYHVSSDFSIETFGTGRWCRDKIEISQSRSRYLDRQD